MKIQSVMKRAFACVGPHDSLDAAAKVMVESGADLLPVVESTHLRGLLRITDIPAIQITRARLAEPLPVDAVMTRELSYCHEDDDVADVRAAMAERHLREIPVLLHRGFPRVVGIVSIHDLEPSQREWKH